jgi:hypothetical protein
MHAAAPRVAARCSFVCDEAPFRLTRSAQTSSLLSDAHCFPNAQRSMLPPVPQLGAALYPTASEQSSASNRMPASRRMSYAVIPSMPTVLCFVAGAHTPLQLPHLRKRGLADTASSAARRHVWVQPQRAEDAADDRYRGTITCTHTYTQTHTRAATWPKRLPLLPQRGACHNSLASATLAFAVQPSPVLPTEADRRRGAAAQLS